jgi:hypothetical protein
MSLFLSLQIFTNLPTKEFGIDTVGEDNKTINHHKVAAALSASSPNKTTTFPAALNNTNNLPLPPLRPRQESAEVDTLNRMSSGVSRSLRRMQSVGDWLCKHRVLEGWAGWKVETSEPRGRAGN